MREELRLPIHTGNFTGPKKQDRVDFKSSNVHLPTRTFQLNRMVAPQPFMRRTDTFERRHWRPLARRPSQVSSWSALSCQAGNRAGVACVAGGGQVRAVRVVGGGDRHVIGGD